MGFERAGWRFVRAGALLVAGALVLAACSSTPSPKTQPLKTLTIGSSNVFPPTLDLTANA